MDLTLKNIKDELTNKIKMTFQDKNLDFENKDVSINGQDYFLCRNVVSTIPEMVAVEERSQPEEDVWNNKTFHLRMRDQKKSLYFGLRKNDRLIAFIGCRVDASMTRMRVMRLSVLPRYVDQDVGTYLVMSLLNKAQQTGIRSVFVQVRNDQIKLSEFYREIGFEKVEMQKASQSKSEMTEFQFLVNENKDKIINE
ncbi:GNAT family N-acetyltransferase [Ligilactobacillus pobuzihii]|uniref:GNAT family N-acetyltransferase n=1 Tax=Ligilactobacillus pobuzihii TaxID=449659 RepID=UPI0019CF7724|nr:GNAT family N-acetyltransferase [Ligilactobacillus pobuzihii]MBN7274292.1 GNAT family N-acetyltransferase [Ligilactobacillus pobuzihii]